MRFKRVCEAEDDEEAAEGDEDDEEPGVVEEHDLSSPRLRPRLNPPQSLLLTRTRLRAARNIALNDPYGSNLLFPFKERDLVQGNGSKLNPFTPSNHSRVIFTHSQIFSFFLPWSAAVRDTGDLSDISIYYLVKSRSEDMEEDTMVVRVERPALITIGILQQQAKPDWHTVH